MRLGRRTRLRRLQLQAHYSVMMIFLMSMSFSRVRNPVPRPGLQLGGRKKA